MEMVSSTRVFEYDHVGSGLARIFFHVSLHLIPRSQDFFVDGRALRASCLEMSHKVFPNYFSTIHGFLPSLVSVVVFMKSSPCSSKWRVYEEHVAQDN